MRAQTADQSLEWARETIDTHAVVHHLETPGKISGTRWQVSRIDGCAIELKETDHREVPDGIVNRDGVFMLDEDKVITWNFNLSSLQPAFVMADTSIHEPHVKIFAQGDAFHTKTEVVTRAVRHDGSTQSTQTWSAADNRRNLTIFFDSPGADNKLLVRRLESDLRDAVGHCVVKASR